MIPEVNRNYNIGEVGANMKRDVYSKYLKHMSLNHVNVKDLGDLSYMTRDAYRRWISGLVDDAVTWQWHSEPLASWQVVVHITPQHILAAVTLVICFISHR